MTSLFEPLQHICRVDATAEGGETSASGDGIAALTHVLVEVTRGEPGTTSMSRNGQSSGMDPVSSFVYYRCPIYILRRASSLMNLIDDTVEADDTDDDAATTTAATTATAAVRRGKDGLHIVPLPFLSDLVFEKIALYLEHFYAVQTILPDPTRDPAMAKQTSGDELPLSTSATSATSPSPALWMSSPASPSPKALRTPLRVDDLYSLSMWEQRFALSCLLGIDDMSEAVWQQLLHQNSNSSSLWVDLLSGAVPRDSKLPTFSVERRSRMLTCLAPVLEGATQLGVVPLQQLCAALFANMVADLDCMAAAALLFASDDVSPSPPIFTAAARAEMLEEMPWLVRPPS